MIESINRVEISLPALKQNFSLLKQKVSDSQILAMVKADAYGHGMLRCAKTLADVGADCFGVAEMAEGVQLRKSGIRLPIYIMAGVLPETIEALFTYQLTPVIVDDYCLQQLSSEAGRRKQNIQIHLKVDAGMGRQGVELSELPKMIQLITSLPGLSLSGIMAHFPKADDPSGSSTSSIIQAFKQQIKLCKDQLPENIVLHLANSGGILYFPKSYHTMVRPGIALYGCYPDGQMGRVNPSSLYLEPVMRFSSRILQVKNVPAGTGLGYGHTFITQRPSTIALIPVGYEDGYLRVLSNRAQGLVRGIRVPAVGRISMNLTMFDVTGVAGVSTGDELVLLGKQEKEEITADEIAGWMDTINYEVLCLFGNLNNRVYVGD